MVPKPYAEIVRRNANRWEAMARHRPGMTVASHQTGESALDAEEIELLGDLKGTRVLHLACSVCDEGISMAMRGAQVVGVDIAPTHVRAGREKAAALGVGIELRVGDMMRLTNDLRGFDLVYISTGGLCWVPDLDDWLVGVRRALKPGGRVLISEHHPIWETLGVAGDRQLGVLSDYFERRTLPELDDPAKGPIGKAETSEDVPLRSFTWGIGALVTALIRHDFRIAALVELPHSDMYVGLGEAADCLPAVYRLLAERD